MARGDETVDWDDAEIRRPYELRPWHPNVVREYARTGLAFLVVLPLIIAVVVTSLKISTFKEAHDWIFDWGPILGTLIGVVLGFYFALERER